MARSWVRHLALPALLWPAMAALAEPRCQEIATAHEAMRNGSLRLERRLEMSVNGEPKKREVARLALEAGVLETEILEEETLSNVFVFDGRGDDPALGIKFDCARLERLSGNRYRLTSEDGLETAVFELTGGGAQAAPVEWRFATVERFLFRKLEIRGRADYTVETAINRQPDAAQDSGASSK